MRNLLLLLTISVLTFSVNAKQISVDEATAVASDFFTGLSPRKVAPRLEPQKASGINATGERNNQPYYVFNNADSNGFVISPVMIGSQKYLHILLTDTLIWIIFHLS